MNRILAFLVALALPMSAMAADSTVDASRSANDWLALVDGGHYAQSWNAASKLLKARITADQWTTEVRAARAKWGALLSRTETGTKTATSLPGAPAGEYVGISFRSLFANMEQATETVTMVKDGNVWKTAGYFIK